MPSDYALLARDELRDIADFADSLSLEEAGAQSLCTEWSVGDVLGHLCSNATMSIPAITSMVIKRRFRVSAALSRGAVEYRDTNAIPAMVRVMRTMAEPQSSLLRGAGRLASPQEFLVDYIVHHGDMRRPIGRARSSPEPRLLAALDAAPKLGGLLGCKKRGRGLRLQATDVEWAYGQGPEVDGSAEALLLALTGRRVALAELRGEGVEILDHRLTS